MNDKREIGNRIVSSVLSPVHISSTTSTVTETKAEPQFIVPELDVVSEQNEWKPDLASMTSSSQVRTTVIQEPHSKAMLHGFHFSNCHVTLNIQYGSCVKVHDHCKKLALSRLYQNILVLNTCDIHKKRDFLT